MKAEIEGILADMPEIKYMKEKVQEIQKVLEEFCDSKRTIANAMYALQGHDLELFEALGCFNMQEVFSKNS